jgi:hypothetical protein
VSCESHKRYVSNVLTVPALLQQRDLFQAGHVFSPLAVEEIGRLRAEQCIAVPDLPPSSPAWYPEHGHELLDRYCGLLSLLGSSEHPDNDRDQHHDQAA